MRFFFLLVFYLVLNEKEYGINYSGFVLHFSFTQRSVGRVQDPGSAQRCPFLLFFLSFFSPTLKLIRVPDLGKFLASHKALLFCSLVRIQDIFVRDVIIWRKKCLFLFFFFKQLVKQMIHGPLFIIIYIGWLPLLVLVCETKFFSNFLNHSSLA